MARIRKNIESAKKAAAENNSKDLYSALRADLLDKISTFTEGKDYLQCMMIVMKLQQMIDRSGMAQDESEDAANEVVDSARAKIAEMEEKFYEEFSDLEEEDEDELDSE